MNATRVSSKPKKRKRKMPKLSLEIEKKLIDQISHNPFLFNRANKFYNDRDLKEKTWIEIANSLGIEVKLVQWKWGKLREQYFRHLKAHKETGTKYNVWHKRFVHYENMHFLQQVYRPRNKKISDLLYESNEEDYLTPAKEESQANFQEEVGACSDSATVYSGDEKPSCEYLDEQYLELCEEIPTPSLKENIAHFLKNVESHLCAANLTMIELLALQSGILNLIRQSIGKNLEQKCYS